MTKCAFAVFLLLALAGQAFAAEIIRVSVPPLVELEYPSSFLRQPNDDKDDIALGALKEANPEGKGLKTPLKWHVPLLSMRHKELDSAAISLVAVPTVEQFTKAIEGDDQALRSFTEFMGDGIRDTFEKQGWSMIQAMAGKRITLRGGRTVLELTSSLRVTGGGIQNYRYIYYPSRHYVINAVVATLPDVQPSVLAEIDGVIQSVRLLADDSAATSSASPVAAGGQGGTKAKTAEGLIRFAEPRVIELAYPETFAPDEKEMLAAADKANAGERLLLLLVHRDPEAAEVAVVVGDPSEGMTQESSSDYTVEELLETVERSSKQQIEIYAKQGGSLHRPMRARNLTLPGGVKATNFEHQERTKDGTLYDRRSIEIYTDRFYLNVFITTSPKVAASTLADIEKVVNSIQFYAGTEKIFTPATWSVAEKSSAVEPPAEENKAAAEKPTTASTPPAAVVEPWPKPPAGGEPGSSSWSGGGSGWSGPAPGGYSKPIHFSGVFSSMGSMLLALLMAASHYGSARARRKERAEYFYLYLLGYYLFLWPMAVSLELLVGGGELTMVVVPFVMGVILLYPPGLFCLRRKKWAFWLGSVVSFSPFLWIGSIVFAFTGGRKVWPKGAVSSPAAPPPLPGAVLGTQTYDVESALSFAAPPVPQPAAVPSLPAAVPTQAAEAPPSQTDYLVHDGTHQYGPMPLEKLRGQVADGWLSREHHYWHDAEAAWKPLAELGV